MTILLYSCVALMLATARPRRAASLMQLSCWSTRTSPAAHAIIQSALDDDLAPWHAHAPQPRARPLGCFNVDRCPLLVTAVTVCGCGCGCGCGGRGGDLRGRISGTKAMATAVARRAMARALARGVLARHGILL